jgi:sec-independent protein translocase protein TatA
MRLGWTELLVILLIVLVLFGAKRLPDLARSLGRSLNEFKKGRQEGEDEAAKSDAKSDAKKHGGDADKDRTDFTR